MEASPGPRKRGRPRTGWSKEKMTGITLHPELVKLIGVIKESYSLSNNTRTLEFLMKILDFHKHDRVVLCMELEEGALDRIMKYLDKHIHTYLMRRWVILDPDTGRKRLIPDLCAKPLSLDIVDFKLPPARPSNIIVEKEVARRFREIKKWNGYSNDQAVKHLISVFFRLDLVRDELCSKMAGAEANVFVWEKLLTKIYPDESLVEFVKRYWLENTQGLYRLSPEVCAHGGPTS